MAGAWLQQLAFWWDSTHLARVDHYLNFVFRQRCVRRGTFTEDTLGMQMLAEIKAGGLAAAEPYAAWVWDDEGRDEECRVVGHLNGAHWRAWTDEAPEDVPLHNSRQEQFRRMMEMVETEGNLKLRTYSLCIQFQNANSRIRQN